MWAVLGQGQENSPFLATDLITTDDSQPIRILADNVSLSQVGQEKVYLLQGKVWVEQGLVSLRLHEGVIWVEKKTGTFKIDLYGEGSATIPATLQQGNERQKAPRARLRLVSRGDVKINAYGGKILERDLTEEPLFQRALAIRLNSPAVNAGASPNNYIARASAQEPPPPSLPGPSNDPGPNFPALPINPSPSLPPLGAPPPSTPPLGPAPMPNFPGSQQPSTSPAPIPNAPGSLPSTAPSPFGGVPMRTGPPSGLPASPLPGPGPITPLEEPLDQGPTRQLFIRPRNALPIQAIKTPLDNGEYAIVVTTGVIIRIWSIKENKVVADIEADRMVMWGKQSSSQDPSHSMDNMSTPQGDSGKSMEFYLAGNVEIRNQTKKETQILRCQECYYDVSRNVALALQADVETKSPKLLNPAHIKAEELQQLGPKLMKGKKVEVFSTVLPADPGLKIMLTEATVEKFDTPRTTVFGFLFKSQKTGETIQTPETIITGNNAVVNLEGVPVWYMPRIKLDANDPLGPLDAIGFGYSTVYGAQIMATWNVFDLIGIVPDSGKKWQMYTDYFSLRGPSIGSWYQDSGKDLFGITNKYEASVRGTIMDDQGTDQIGASRGTQAYTSPTTFVPVSHPDVRGWYQGRINMWDMDNGFMVQSQLVAISDRNYLDQYFNSEWNNGINEETFAYVKQQQNNWAWTVLGEQRIRQWITETNWLPKVDGYVLGASFFDFLNWNTHASAGYAQLKTASTEPQEYIPTDVAKGAGRFDWWQEFSAPFNVGDVKVVPYTVLDLTYYTDDIAGNDIGRIYGGVGLRASVPFSRLFPDVKSELFNLNGIFHKITLSGNYFYAQTNVHYNQLPQFDQLNDDATNQALRDIYPVQGLYNPGNAINLMTNKLFDPQYYAIQRLVDNKVDTLDDIDVLQLDLRQRWQTKRGFPGDEHVVDWMILDLQASIFPQPNRDNNSNQPLGIVSYDWLWNIGDRTALFSSGWADPVSGGPHFFNIGASVTRPDRTNFTLSYRQIDPLLSKAVIASVVYPMSQKYALTASTTYDFGVHNQVNTVMLTRIGTDLRFSIGASYNSIINNFSFVMEIVPNFVPNRTGGGGMGLPKQ